MMKLTPQVFTSEVSLLHSPEQSEPASNRMSIVSGGGVPNQSTNLNQQGIIKSNLFSPVMKLDLVRKGESEIFSPNPAAANVISRRLTQNLATHNGVGDFQPKTLNSHRTFSSTTTVAGIYNLAQKTRRASNFCKSSAQEVYRKEV